MCATLSALVSLAPTGVFDLGEGLGAVALASMFACALALGAFA